MMKIVRFEQDGVRVFLLHTDELVDAGSIQKYYARMSDARRSKIDRQRTGKGKMLSLGAGILLDEGLKEYGLRERGAHVVTKENGKPYLLDYPEVHFNLSHSREMVLAVFADTEVGCDVEREGVLKLQIARRFFCPSEYAYIASQPEDGRAEAFYQLWTLKESFMKVTGLGMKLMPYQFEFRFGAETGQKDGLGSAWEHVGMGTAGNVKENQEEAGGAVFRYTRKVAIRQDVDDAKYRFMEYFSRGYHMAVCVKEKL